MFLLLVAMLSAKQGNCIIGKSLNCVKPLAACTLMFTKALPAAHATLYLQGTVSGSP